MPSQRVRSSRILLLPVLLAVSLSAWMVQVQRAHSSEPPGRTDPTASDVAAEKTARWTDELRGSAAKIEPSLLKRISEDDSDAAYRFLVELVQQANLDRQPATASQAENRAWLVSTLQATAQASQADIRADLEIRRARGQVVDYHSFWIFNGLAVTANADTLLDLAARSDVRAILEDPWRRWLDSSLATGHQFQSVEDDLEWNISRVRADLAWSAFGLDGTGVTVAIMDTGVDWQHPALQSQYRGYKPGGLVIHQGNWFCTTDEGYLYPVDSNGHGTHVTGTALGGRDDTGRAIGVAPGARWIAVKMLDDFGYGYDSWIHAAFEWIMAPAGDPALAPDVVNASWGVRNAASETFRSDVEILRTAGIVPVFAAGNEGPGSSTLRSPGSYPEAIAVGASDDLDKVASFSSRGPSPWEEVKPEVVAPGTQIRSSHPGGTYRFRSGTSMATPHVSGLAALLLQADPTLTVDEIEAIVTSSALPLGTEVPNNASGWGRIDAYQAAAIALEAGFVTGQVTRQPDWQPLPTAQITVYDHLGDPRALAQTDENGRYRVALPAGQYELNVQAFGYTPQTVPDLSVQIAATTTVDLTLAPLPTGVLWGAVSDVETSAPVSASLSIMDAPVHSTSDPNTGQYSLALPAGTYTLQVARNGYRRHTVPDLEIVADGVMRVDVALTPAPTLLLVDSGRWYYGSQASYFEQALEDRDYVYDLWEVRDTAVDSPSLADLAPYEITVWSSPLDAPGLIGAGDTISNYLSTGGNLFLTGQDVGYWEDGLSGLNWHPYYAQFLKAKALTDNAGRADLLGLPEEILHGLSLPMNGPDSAGNQVSPDSITLLDPRDAAIIGRYADDGEAGLHVIGCQSYRAVYLAAGLEGLGDRLMRAETMDRILTWLDTPHPATAADLYPARQDEVWITGTVVTYTVELRNTGQSTDQFTFELSPSAWPVSVWDSSFSRPIGQSLALDACQTQTLGLQVTVPLGVAWNVTAVVTLTARSTVDPTYSTRARFTSKAPAPILLVDDHRWFDTSGRYRSALEANGWPFDEWRVQTTSILGVPGLPLQRMQRYPVVIWFTAYDWYKTLTPEDESQLTRYLDGGGRLLLSSQDYLYTSGFNEFAQDYLGVADYTESLTATQAVGAVGNPVGDGFDLADLVYPFHNWSDAVRPAPEASIAFWGQHGQPTALTLAQSPWKTAFYAFPLEAFRAGDMATIVGRTVDWLSPLGDSSLTVDSGAVAPGGRLTYTLSMHNTGPRLLEHVTLSNTVPPATTYVAASLQGPAAYDPVLNRFVWDGALGSGESIVVTYQLLVNGATAEGTTVRNVAHLNDESGLTIDRVAVSRVNAPDLSMSDKSARTFNASPGQVLTYTLALRNDGLRPAEAHLVDPVPLHTVYLPGRAWASSGLLTPAEGILVWDGSIPVNQVVTITFPVVISPSAIGGYVFNRATLEDGWGSVIPLEAYTWTEARLFMPLVFKSD